MSKNKTQPTSSSAEVFLASIEHPVRQADARALLALMKRVTRCPPVVWGPSMIGFGSYHYRYESGREGDSLAVGFSPRKTALALYGLLSAPESAGLLAKLGKHKKGAGCLYLAKLEDVDRSVLERLVRAGFRHHTGTKKT